MCGNFISLMSDRDIMAFIRADPRIRSSRVLPILTSSPPGGPPMVFIDDVLKWLTTPTAN